MRDGLKTAVLFLAGFAVFYLLWNVFWRSVFFSFDTIGVFWTVVFLIWLPALPSVLRYLFAGQKKAGGLRTEPSRVVSDPALSIQEPVKGEQKLCGRLSDVKEAPVSPQTSASEARATVDGAASFATATADEFVSLVSEVKGLDERCAKGWNRSKEEWLAYRKLRRIDRSAARQFSEVVGHSSDDDIGLVPDIDRFFDRLCGMYLLGDSQRRGEIRASMEHHRRLMGNLHNYAARAARRLRQGGDADLLLKGLAAVSIDDDRSCQSYASVLAGLYVAALHAGIDPSPSFRAVADISSTEPSGIRAKLESFEGSRDFEIFVGASLSRHAIRE